MNNREKFKRRVIELIHGLPYADCRMKEWGARITVVSPPLSFFSEKITIGRVMQALCRVDCSALLNKGGGLKINTGMEYDIPIIIHWKLCKENGQECTDDDQSDDTIDALLQLLS